MKLRVAVLIRALMVVAVMMMNFAAAPKVSAAPGCQDCKTCWFLWTCCKAGTHYSTCRVSGFKCWTRKCGSFDDEGEEDEVDSDGDADGDGDAEMY